MDFDVVSSIEFFDDFLEPDEAGDPQVITLPLRRRHAHGVAALAMPVFALHQLGEGADSIASIGVDEAVSSGGIILWTGYLVFLLYIRRYFFTRSERSAVQPPVDLQ